MLSCPPLEWYLLVSYETLKYCSDNVPEKSQSKWTTKFLTKRVVKLSSSDHIPRLLLPEKSPIQMYWHLGEKVLYRIFVKWTGKMLDRQRAYQDALKLGQKMNPITCRTKKRDQCQTTSALQRLKICPEKCSTTDEPTRWLAICPSESWQCSQNNIIVGMCRRTKPFNMVYPKMVPHTKKTKHDLMTSTNVVRDRTKFPSTCT